MRARKNLYNICAATLLALLILSGAFVADALGQQGCPGDFDCDGIPDAIEDKNGNGKWDASEGETDFQNSDTDGDCLPDGLEMGLTEAEARALVEGMKIRPVHKFSERCLKILQDKKITVLANAIAADPNAPQGLSNISILFDLDPSSTTDPTSEDSDNDGVIDGMEDFNFNGRRDFEGDFPPEEGAIVSWLETDPNDSDSDGDGLLDGEEGDRDGDGEIGFDESDPLRFDSDGDGVSDSEERRIGTLPNKCDTDGDGLSDGIELGKIQPIPYKGCHGLQAVGTNFKRPSVLDPLNPDSDGDGRLDGEEDANANGWLDAEESDPTVADTDGDGLEDGLEDLGDFDGDGVPDFDYTKVVGEGECLTPASIHDIDCDGIPNSRDEDSDGDGCPDSMEGGVWVDANNNGIPDVYDPQAKVCPDPSAGGGGGGGGKAPDSSEVGSRASEESKYFFSDAGGSCALLLLYLPDNGIAKIYVMAMIFILAVSSVIALKRRLSQR